MAKQVAQTKPYKGGHCVLIRALLAPGTFQVDHATEGLVPTADFYGKGSEEWVTCGIDKNAAIESMVKQLNSMKD